MLKNINKRVNLNFVAKDPHFLNAECKVRSFVNMEVCPFGSTFQRIMGSFLLIPPTNLIPPQLSGQVKLSLN